MYCKHCGKEIADNSTFCKYCGKKIEDAVQNKDVPPSIPNLPKVDTQKRKRMRIAIGAGIAFLLVIIVSISVVVITKKEAARKEEALMLEIQKEKEEKKKEEKKESEETKKEKKDILKDYNKSDSASQEKNEAPKQSAPVQPSPNVSNDYIFPDSSSRYISESELYNLTADQCCFARNEIYARHHRLFATDYIQAYFNSKSWYSGTIAPENFSPDLLNEIETVNVATILNYEQRMGWQ